MLVAAQQTVLSADYVSAANPDNAIAFNGIITTPTRR
jgi:hypothetical protein